MNTFLDTLTNIVVGAVSVSITAVILMILLFVVKGIYGFLFGDN